MKPDLPMVGYEQLAHALGTTSYGRPEAGEIEQGSNLCKAKTIVQLSAVLAILELAQRDPEVFASANDRMTSLAHPRNLVTNRHVAEVFACGEGDRFVIQPGPDGDIVASIDLLMETVFSWVTVAGWSMLPLTVSAQCKYCRVSAPKAMRERLFDGYSGSSHWGDPASVLLGLPKVRGPQRQVGVRATQASERVIKIDGHEGGGTPS